MFFSYGYLLTKLAILIFPRKLSLNYVILFVQFRSYPEDVESFFSGLMWIAFTMTMCIGNIGHNFCHCICFSIEHVTVNYLSWDRFLLALLFYNHCDYTTQGKLNLFTLFLYLHRKRVMGAFKCAQFWMILCLLTTFVAGVDNGSMRLKCGLGIMPSCRKSAKDLRPLREMKLTESVNHNREWNFY